jgi:hypothetical protein
MEEAAGKIRPLLRVSQIQRRFEVTSSSSSKLFSPSLPSSQLSSWPP